MHKIPVIPTIKAAYNFVFTHLGAIIGLIWLPMVMLTVIGFFVEQRYYSALANALASNNFARLGPAVVGMFCYFIFALLLYAVMLVPVIQLAQGQRKDAVLVHFALGPAEWRTFRALAGLVAFLMLPVVAAILLIFSLSPLIAGVHGSAAVLAASGQQLAGVLVYLGILYLALRFVFLLPAVAVSEEGPVLPRAWILSAGNFWRILAVMLATLGPVVAAAAIAQFLLEGPGALMPDFSNSTAMASAQLHLISLNMPVSKGINFLIAPLTLGLTSGASVAAFVALKTRVTDI